MDKRDSKEILARYLSDNVTEKERALVERWILQEPESFADLRDEELWMDLADIRNRVFSEEKPAKTIWLWPRLAAAACMLLMLSIGGYFIMHKPGRIQTDVARIKQDVLPGKNGAILTLANGQKVMLELTGAGTIAQQNGARLNKTNDSSLVYNANGKTGVTNIAYNTLETPRGRQYSVVLPDGTKIWLNAASSIKYPTSFTALKERKVFLTGEAYFEVAKDKKHPFKVITSTQEVRVLGTHFNVNSYADEQAVNTNLFEGSVKINEFTILKPGQQANLYRSGKVSVSPGSANAIAWKDGKFSFDDTSMEEILKQLSRWYDVEIVYPNGIPQETFSGYIDRKLNAADALDILKYTKVDFKIEGKKIIVFK
jgi:ferric-dicitrate binding protein FerR (iron transport regulator)